ncbi:hypothetical protein EV426DRAFT_645734, partial [Tirmania nivea]
MREIFGSGKSEGDGGSKKRPAQSNNPTTAPQKKSRLHPFRKQYSGSPSSNPTSSVSQQARSASPSSSSAPSNAPHPSSSVQQQATPHIPSTGGGNDLWTKAYNELPKDLKQHLSLNDKLQTLESLLQTVYQAKEAKMAKRMKFNLGGKEINVQDAADRLFGWITKFKEVGDITMQYDPVHAALPWAGVRFILLLVVGDQEKFAAAIVGMERIAVLIGRCAIYEQLYLTGSVLKNVEVATENLRRVLLTLYTAVLQALCRLIRVFMGKWVDKLKTSESTLAEIRAIDDPEAAVNSAVIAVENCYNSATREHNKERFNELQRLLKDFMPVISRIDRNVDKMYKDIEETKRITILQWFSTIPYRSHHDLACEGRVEHTGTWLFKRKEFTCWESSTMPAILWLHGIPGAGKTKLVSATIDYLNSTSQFDKVAFFYCKRDEADRRDKEKILLSLIKQLACPPGHARICARALEAYTEEQKDPSSRRQLNFNSCLKLLGRLVECFGQPVVVLDALDECSEEVRSDLLPGLLSLIREAKCPFKVFISSRHNLDIENHLQDLPHVCIEARDNAEDIENYVRQQLTFRIQNKRLLQGNVSQKLRKDIEDKILRDAKGMFLWVDWQLHELCKLLRESDIRARLGRLPKGLTGVYDEIMYSIKSQPDCSFSLASNALQWMLVSKRPLKPTELVVAVQLNPSISMDSSHPSQESALAVELLIQSCEGLLLLDTTLDVVRFSHLSVQEYLETWNSIWDISIIDTQLFVSESCLWTLQYSSLNSPLYDYAASHWFEHCRSFQDLVLSAAKLKDTKHKLSIPLLDSFLGSFQQASASYVKWADWVYGTYNDKQEYFSILCIYSTPIYPAFSAAFAGLGELVGWLWNVEGNDMEVRNNDNTSLLSVAIEYGTTWIVAEMLKRGCRIDHNQDPLFRASDYDKLDIMKMLLDHGADINALPQMKIYREDYGSVLISAAYGGNLEIVTHLLDRGAHVNLTGGFHHSALSAAAYAGNLEIVILLLNQGADVNRTGGYHGSALGAAAIGGHLEIVTLLLDRGAGFNISHECYGSVLGMAAFMGRYQIVTLLLDRGAHVNLTGGGYGSALSAAVCTGSLEVVTLLLDRGADVNLSCGDRGSALGVAANCGNLGIVTYLLDRGADVNLSCGHYGSALSA